MLSSANDKVTSAVPAYRVTSTKGLSNEEVVIHTRQCNGQANLNEMCRWGCQTTNTTYMCRWCGTRYCKECLRGDFQGHMKEGTKCRICNQERCQGQRVEYVPRPPGVDASKQKTSSISAKGSKSKKSAKASKSAKGKKSAGRKRR